MRLGKLCDVRSGGTPKRSVPEYWNEGSIPWVKISDISNKYVSSTEEQITEEGLRGSSAKILAPGTLLYSIFASIGAVGILEIPAATNQAIAGLSIKTDRVIRDYLYHFLKSQQTLAKSSGRGAAQNNINLTILRGMEVPLPSIDDQKEIVDQLEGIAVQIEQATAQIDQLDSLVKSRFVEMFASGVFPSVSFGDVCLKINNGITRRGNDPDGDIVLRLVELQEGFIDYAKPNRIRLTQKEKERFSLVDGDLLFARVNGNPKNVGRCASFSAINESVYHNDHVIRATFDHSKYNPVFLVFFMNSSKGRAQIEAAITTSAGQYTINQAGIKSIQVPLPPLAFQQEFAAFVSQVDKSRFS